MIAMAIKAGSCFAISGFSQFSMNTILILSILFRVTVFASQTGNSQRVLRTTLVGAAGNGKTYVTTGTGLLFMNRLMKNFRIDEKKAAIFLKIFIGVTD